MSNRKLGNDFENELCEIFAKRGWWVTRLLQDESGQPVDIIAAKNNTAVLIDAKVCSNDRFELSRVEANQEGAMRRWEETGNGYGYFAVKLLKSDEIYMIAWCAIELLNSMNRTGIKDFSQYVTLNDWFERMEGIL